MRTTLRIPIFELRRRKATHELKKLRLISPMSAEGTVVRNYLDWLLSIPWNKKSKTNKDLVHAQQILDHDHYGLEKVKERIVEYLAVQQRANKLTGPILCLVGPPGVGKTSLGKSIAHASGRDFVRVSLGGVHDEAEIRGHRRTYIGWRKVKVSDSRAAVDFAVCMRELTDVHFPKAEGARSRPGQSVDALGGRGDQFGPTLRSPADRGRVTEQPSLLVESDLPPRWQSPIASLTPSFVCSAASSTTSSRATRRGV